MTSPLSPNLKYSGTVDSVTINKASELKRGSEVSSSLEKDTKTIEQVSSRSSRAGNHDKKISIYSKKFVAKAGNDLKD